MLTTTQSTIHLKTVQELISVFRKEMAIDCRIKLNALKQQHVLWMLKAVNWNSQILYHTLKRFKSNCCTRIALIRRAFFFLMILMVCSPGLKQLPKCDLTNSFLLIKILKKEFHDMPFLFY